ncbi:hypothetical protein DPMN_024220 [Dreissena polymorpha]|uniref:Uncharacterized protein n=1 Tax=Dreissena polymorpha TaxID=45954 RepID=A0A9D4LP56_DREPO|nr:hypothetical protein DPMN_024220 [Dreissena polymorpha]
MPKGVNLPANLWTATFSEVQANKLKAETVLVYYVQIVGCSLVIHAPASENYFQRT